MASSPEYNRQYHKRRGWLFQFSEHELEPSLIDAMIECLENKTPSARPHADKRLERLRVLRKELIG